MALFSKKTSADLLNDKLNKMAKLKSILDTGPARREALKAEMLQHSAEYEKLQNEVAELKQELHL